MQRKINHYWKRKETSDETLSSVATKVQRTESNVSRPTQSGAISDPLPVHQDQVEEKCSTVYPLIWTEQQYEEFKQKNSWMYASDGKVGCTPCHEVNNLGVRASRGVNISTQWADGNVTFYGSTRTVQLSSLRKKICEHRNSKAHQDAINILETAKKDVLLNLNAQSKQSAFQSTARVFRTAYYVAKNSKPFTDFEKLINLQQANSIDMGRVLHSKTVAVDIIEHISSHMKKKTLTKIIESRSKINVLADESTRVGDKSTLIVFLRASIDGKAAPITFPLDLVDLESLCASHIADKIVDCLLKNGYSIELLQEVIIGFCSDGASVMLGTTSGVGKLLKDKFPDIILWHCLNHRLELAVGIALEIIGGTNDFQSFLEHLYSLYSQSPKNKRELDQCSHDLQTTLKRIGKVFTIRWVASSFRAVSAVWHSFPALAQHFDKASNDETRQSTEKARFRGILSKFCTINFVKNLALMADVLNELTNLSETLQSRNTTLPKAHTLLNAYTKRIESLVASPGEHSIMAEQAEKAMSFQQVELREGRSPVINQAQFIRVIADNMKERLFTTASSRAQPSVHATRRENYKTLVVQIDVLDPQKIDHENPRFGEDEVKSLCSTLRLNKQKLILRILNLRQVEEEAFLTN